MGSNRRPATEAEARALASAIRLRILRLCLETALTNREIAQRLDANPATTLHHVRKLVDTGFLAPQEIRRGTRGAREIPYLATGKSWTLDVQDSGGGQAMLDAFLQEIRLVPMEETHKGMSRLGLRLTPDEYAELTRRLQDLLDEFAARPPSTDGRAYSMFVSIHRDVSREAG